MIAALFVETNGCYFGLEGVDPWDVERDARKYAGPYPVVAHPPCFLWVNMAAVNWKRYKRQLPAWYPDGTDGDCFAHSILNVERYGGVLEHPAFSHAWEHFNLPRPAKSGGWARTNEIGYKGGFGYVCEVWQAAYGHKCRKRTWLYYVGESPPTELKWQQPTGTHQVGWFDRIKPTVGKREASATPVAFRDALIDLARQSRGERRAA